jgi:hypothetical protein
MKKKKSSLLNERKTMSKIDEIIKKAMELKEHDIEQCPETAIYKFTVGDNITRLACSFHFDFLLENNGKNKHFEYKKLNYVEQSYNHCCECMQLKEQEGGG